MITNSDTKACIDIPLLVENVIEYYRTNHLSNLKSGAKILNALHGNSGLLKSFSSRDIQSLERRELVSVLRDRSRTSPISANRQLAYARAFFNWCLEEELALSNPLARVRKLAPENMRERYHTSDEIKEIWHAASRLTYPFGPLFQSLMLLPLRRAELASLRVNEIKNDGVDAYLSLPSRRAKNGQPAKIALSRASHALLIGALRDKRRPPFSDFVFTVTGRTPVSGFSRAKHRLDHWIDSQRKARGQGLCSMDPWTLHDLRTTFATHACEHFGAPPTLVDRILNHVASSTHSKIMRTYNRSEMYTQKRELLEKWASFIMQKIA